MLFNGVAQASLKRQLKFCKSNKIILKKIFNIKGFSLVTYHKFQRKDLGDCWDFRGFHHIRIADIDMDILAFSSDKSKQRRSKQMI